MNGGQEIIFGQTKYVGGSIKSAYNRIVKQEITYTTSTQKVIDKYQNNQIVSVSVNRTPIQASRLLKVAGVSLDEKPYDQLYHLFMILTLDNGVTISLEKNDVIKLSTSNLKRANTESLSSAAPKNTNLIVLLNKTNDLMGYPFHRYDAIQNNCQDFLLSVMKANRFGTKKVKDFVKQDVSSLIGRKTEAALKNITRVAGIYQTLTD